MTLRVTGGDVSVTLRGEAVGDAEGILGRLAADGVPAALMAKNTTLWGPDATEDAARRLGWVDLPERSCRLLPRLAELSERFAGLDRVVLAGMGGAPLAAEVISRAGGGDLTVLDTTDAGEVGRAAGLHDAPAGEAGRLDRTVLVVSSKDGTAIETDGNRRVFERAFRDAGIDPAERTVVVTDPGSPVEASAEEAGYAVVTADPDVGGRYGALSASALVPSALSGADVRCLLGEAAALAPGLCGAYGNPGLALGAALGTAAAGGHDRLVLTDDGSGLGGWTEHLISESTGKDGGGILPVVVEDTGAPGFDSGRGLVLGGGGADAGMAVSGPLGGQFLLWEYATAVACRVIGVNPFDEPRARESEDDTAARLRAAHGAVMDDDPLLVDGDVEVHAGPEFAGATDLAGVLDATLGALPAGGYLAVMAYLDRTADAVAVRLRPLLARRAGAPVTFGWGPRLLHGTGQYHKSGPPVGVFLQITGAVAQDVAVPGRPYGLRAVQHAQASGDLRALRARGRPVVRLHLRDRAAGLAQLEAVLGG